MNKTNATTQAHINQKQYIKVRQSQGRIQPLSRADITEGESAGQDPMGLSGFFLLNLDVKMVKSEAISTKSRTVLAFWGLRSYGIIGTTWICA